MENDLACPLVYYRARSPVLQIRQWGQDQPHLRGQISTGEKGRRRQKRQTQNHDVLQTAGKSKSWLPSTRIIKIYIN